MLLTAILILFLLALINYRISGRALLHPAAAYSLFWAVDLLLIWLVGDFFYPLSPQAILIFVGGAVFFSIGSGIVSLLFAPNEAPDSRTTGLGNSGQKLLTRIVAFEILSLPLVIRWMMSQVAEHPGGNLVVRMARAFTDDSVKATFGYTLFGNLVLAAHVIALVAFYERENHKLRSYIACALALGLEFSIALRSSIVPFFLSLLCLYWLKTRRVPWKQVFAFFAVLFVLAGSIAIFLGKGETDPNASLIDNAGPLMQSMVMYAAGGPVAFDQELRNPAVQAKSSLLGAALITTLNRVGAHLQEPDPEAGPGFMELGPRHLVTNIYSIYGEYLALGYPAMMGLMMLLGVWITSFYGRAMLGMPFAGIMYAMLFGSLALSPFAEIFFASVYYYSKVCVVLWFVYLFPGNWSFSTRILGAKVESDLSRLRVAKPSSSP
jgi:oligosaccharide repeat unit polymerase